MLQKIKATPESNKHGARCFFFFFHVFGTTIAPQMCSVHIFADLSDPTPKPLRPAVMSGRYVTPVKKSRSHPAITCAQTHTKVYLPWRITCTRHARTTHNTHSSLLVPKDQLHSASGCILHVHNTFKLNLSQPK